MNVGCGQAYSRRRTTPLQGRSASTRVRLTHPESTDKQIGKLAAGVCVVGQAGNVPVSGHILHAEGESFAGTAHFGRAVVGDGLLQNDDDGDRMAHVYLLHENWRFKNR